MADNPRPIFPPDELNYSQEALKASEALLDDETRAILEADRARLAQTTVLGAFTLGQELGLSTETTQELQAALLNRLSSMSPLYHGYMNQLLGAAATSLLGQLGSERTQLTEPAPVHVVPDSQADAGAPVEYGPPLPEDHLAGIIGDQEEVLTYDPEDIIVLSEDSPLIFDHEKTHRNTRQFIRNVFPELEDQLKSLPPRVASLLVYQAIDFYMAAEIPQASPGRKANQKQRIELYTGLYRPVQPMDDMLSELGVSGASLYTGMQRVAQNITSMIDHEEMLRKAQTTAEFGTPEDIFTSDTSTEQTLLEVTPTADMNDDGEDGLTVDDSVHEEAAQSTEEVVPGEFYEHARIPANMRNFLLGIFPAEFGDRILSLNQWSTSMLTYQLVEVYRDIVTSGAPEHHERRCQWTERWTGLYGEPVDEEVLARRAVVSPQSVKSSIERVIKTLETQIPKDQLKEHFYHAESSVPPRRTAVSSY